MTKTVFRGFTFDTRTVEMIKWAESKAGFKFRITQGSYSDGVAASAGTHDGGGAADFSVRLMLPAKRVKMIRALKDAGFAAWYRTKSDGFTSNHVHAIAIGCKDLAPLAKSQVVDYDRHRDGLKGHNFDPTYRPVPKVKFSEKLNKPVSRELADSVVSSPAVPAKNTTVKKPPAKK
jgi:hypothetical protein